MRIGWNRDCCGMKEPAWFQEASTGCAEMPCRFTPASLPRVLLKEVADRLGISGRPLKKHISRAMP